jgi:hypothetical protein
MTLVFARTTRAALFINRIVWAALVAGPLCFGAIIIVLLYTSKPPGQSAPPLVFYLAVAGGLLLPAIGYAVRYVVWRLGRMADGHIALPAWSVGNILCWFFCEGITYFSLVLTLINFSLIPNILPAAWALFMLILAYPRKSTLLRPDATLQAEITT